LQRPNEYTKTKNTIYVQSDAWTAPTKDQHSRFDDAMNARACTRMAHAKDDAPNRNETPTIWATRQAHDMNQNGWDAKVIIGT
jgi:hypothetical protein